MFVRGPEALTCNAVSLSLPSLFFLQCINVVLMILKIALCLKNTTVHVLSFAVCCSIKINTQKNNKLCSISL